MLYVTWQEARRGNLEFIGSLPQPELLRLLGKHDEDGRTLLHSAAAGGSSALVSYLLEHGAVSAVNRPDEEVCEGWSECLFMNTLPECCCDHPQNVHWCDSAHFRPSEARTDLAYMLGPSPFLHYAGLDTAALCCQRRCAASLQLIMEDVV